MGHKTYVIADLHGRFDLLSRALGKIHEQTQAGHTPHKVVFLGDYIDRGPASGAIISRLMLGPGPRSNGRWVCLQGNHEAMMVDALTTGKNLNMWLANGGNTTLLSYGAKAGSPVADALKLVPQSHVDWLAELPFLHKDEHRVFTHAFINRYRTMAEQTPEQCQWGIWPTGEDEAYFGHHIVHGHEQQEDYFPLFGANRTNLDTAAYFSGLLYVGVFDDERPGPPISFMEIR